MKPPMDLKTFISIHAPRTGSDEGWKAILEWVEDFNPRSPHGERQTIWNNRLVILSISIHAPRTGSDFRALRVVRVIR